MNKSQKKYHFNRQINANTFLIRHYQDFLKMYKEEIEDQFPLIVHLIEERIEKHTNSLKNAYEHKEQAKLSN